jgi:asparagine synthase (glutamine-hydrolysing)
MCGLAGIFSFKQRHNSSLIKLMTNAMAHRGPDADGFYEDENISLGHRRLSIIDLSVHANQPLLDSTNNYVIIFNGEIYNYKEVKAKLKNYNFKTSSDTEVVLAAYITWGDKAVDELKGMFCFAIYDKQYRKLFIARDRLGVKPLYYYKDETYFIFASEIRAIMATGLVPKKIDINALGDYFSTQSFTAPNTIIQEIKQLQAGHSLLIENMKCAINQYWNIEKPETTFDITDKESAKNKVYELMQQSVERRLVSDVPVAAFLSGGIDSSAIVGLMSQYTNAPETFNIAFDESEYDESHYAEIIAKKFNTKHHKILLKPTSFLEELPNGLNAMDIPSGDGINSYVVSKEIVKKGIKVAMSGVGGDELFAGYPTFKHWTDINKKKWIWNVPKSIRTFGSSILSEKSSKSERIKKLLKTDTLSMGNFYPLVREVMSNKTINSITNKKLIQQQFEIDVSGFDFPLLSQMSIAEFKGFAYNTLLKDADQFSMAVSLEIREPFFDHDLIEYVLQIPDAFKYPNYPKQLLVESLQGLLPDEIVHRKKKGFSFPWESWMNNELKSFCEMHIKSFAQRDFINGAFVESMWIDFLHKKKYRWQEIWLMVVLEYWLNKNFD